MLIDSEIRSPVTDQHFQNSIPNEGSTKPRMQTSEHNNYEQNLEGGEYEVIQLDNRLPPAKRISIKKF